MVFLRTGYLERDGKDFYFAIFSKRAFRLHLIFITIIFLTENLCHLLQLLWANRLLVHTVFSIFWITYLRVDGTDCTFHGTNMIPGKFSVKKSQVNYEKIKLAYPVLMKF